MSPSADGTGGARRAPARSTVTAALSVIVLAGGSTLPLSASAATASPGAAPTGPVASAPVLDVSGQPLAINGPVLDMVLTVSNLDGSLTDANGPKTRVLTLAADVLFAFGKATLAPAASSRLHEVAADIKAAAVGRTLQLHVDGYTDSVGSTSYNAALSANRAKAVAAALHTLLPGTAANFVVSGHGAANPVAPNTLNGKDNPKGRALNRRVTVSFAKPAATG